MRNSGLSNYRVNQARRLEIEEPVVQKLRRSVADRSDSVHGVLKKALSDLIVPDRTSSDVSTFIYDKVTLPQ
jgi:hypothetical protein